MLNKKTLIIRTLKKTLIIGFALGLTACANSDELETKITNLSNQVDRLSNDVAELKSQHQAITEDVKSAKVAAEQAAEDAKNANERIDNVVASYKK